MGANVPYRVRVLRLVEDEVEVYALDRAEAAIEASRLPDVARVIEVKEVV